MKVLTSDAVQDPTRVEARVRREVAMRKHTHEKMNVERKLTDDQRREKVENKKVEEEKKGISGAVFKYVYLLSSLRVLGSHVFETQGQEPVGSCSALQSPEECRTDEFDRFVYLQPWIQYGLRRGRAKVYPTI